jgi:hypothetical protein
MIDRKAKAGEKRGLMAAVTMGRGKKVPYDLSRETTAF